MKNISEYLNENNTTPLKESILLGESYIIDEGLKSIFKAVKDKFFKVVQYLKNVCVKLSNKFPVWMPVDKDGNLIPVSLPMTPSQAYVDGFINKTSTVVVGSKEVKDITGNKAVPSDAYSLYGAGNSLTYWKQQLKENEEDKDEYQKLFESLGIDEEILTEVKMQNMDPTAKYNVLDNKGLMDIVTRHVTGKVNVPLLIFGAPGIGKTAILKTVLNSLPDGKEYQLVVKTLSHETADNFTLPKYVDTDRGTRADDVPKMWLPAYEPTGDPVEDARRDKDCGKGLLFIDELSRATPQVLNVCLPIINEKTFNGWIIGSGWKIICASNRAEDDETGQAVLGNALKNRFQIVYYEPTVNDWKQWAKNQKYISPLLIQWLELPGQQGGSKYFYYDPNDSGQLDDPGEVMCTPRSWDNAMQILCSYSTTGSLEGFNIFDIPQPIIGSALNGCIPSEAVDSFLSFLHTISKIGDFDKAVRDVWSGKGLKIDSADLRKIALPLAQLIVTSHNKDLPTEQEFDNLCTWLIKDGNDQLASYVMDVFKEVFGDTLKTNSFKDWMFKIKHVFDMHKKALANAPADFKKLKNQKQRDEWYDSLEASGKYSEAELKKYFELANAEDKESSLLAEYKDFFKKWKLKGIDDMPDYVESIRKLAKKYGSGIKITLANGSEADLF